MRAGGAGHRPGELHSGSEATPRTVWIQEAQPSLPRAFPRTTA